MKGMRMKRNIRLLLPALLALFSLFFPIPRCVFLAAGAFFHAAKGIDRKIKKKKPKGRKEGGKGKKREKENKVSKRWEGMRETIYFRISRSDRWGPIGLKI